MLIYNSTHRHTLIDGITIPAGTLSSAVLLSSYLPTGTEIAVIQAIGGSVLLNFAAGNPSTTTHWVLADGQSIELPLKVFTGVKMISADGAALGGMGLAV